MNQTFAHQQGVQSIAGAQSSECAKAPAYRYDWLQISLYAITTLNIVLIPVMVEWIDLPVAQFFTPYRHTEFKEFFFYVSRLGDGGIWAVLGVGLFVYSLIGSAPGNSNQSADRVGAEKPALGEMTALQCKKDLCGRAGLLMLSALIVSAVSVNIMKWVVSRSRPFMHTEQNIDHADPFTIVLGMDSFPSGHTQTIFAALLPIAIFFPRWRILAAFLIAITSLSRILVVKHYISDIVGGAAYAVLAVLCLLPHFQPGGTAYPYCRQLVLGWIRRLQAKMKARMSPA